MSQGGYRREAGMRFYQLLLDEVAASRGRARRSRAVPIQEAPTSSVG
jgi:hypothetical protein